MGVIVVIPKWLREIVDSVCWEDILGRSGGAYVGRGAYVGNVSGARHQWTRGDVQREEQGDSF